MYPCLFCWKEFPTWERVSLHATKGHEQFREFWSGNGRMFVEMYEKGEFAGRKTEVQEMMKALNQWWQEETSEHPGSGTVSDLQATEFRLFLGLNEMTQKAFMAGFFEAFKVGVKTGPEMKKNLEEGTKEMLNRSLRATDQKPG
jgi:hypothetical protein